MHDIRAIFFDIGDTLVFDAPTLSERLTAAALSAGVRLDPARLPAAFRATEAFAVRRYVAGIAWDAPGALRETVNYLWKAMALPVLSDSQWAAFAGAFAAAPFTRYAHPKAAQLLTELKQRGFVLGAISDWEDTLPDVLTDLGLRSFFDMFSISACVGVTKPDPRLFQNAMRQTDLLPQNCLHVGDWYELDAAGANAAGMQTLLFDWAGRCPDADCPRVTTFQQCIHYLLALPLPEERIQAGIREGNNK